MSPNKLSNITKIETDEAWGGTVWIWHLNKLEKNFQLIFNETQAQSFEILAFIAVLLRVELCNVPGLNLCFIHYFLQGDSICAIKENFDWYLNSVGTCPGMFPH